MQPYVVLDIESTGLFYEIWDEPIEVCAIKVIDGKEEIFHEYMKPYKKVPKKVEELTKITNSFLENKENKYKVLPKLRRFIGDLPVVAHNASFDVPFLNFWFNILDLPLITKRLCTLKAFKKHTGQKIANLTAATNYFSICLSQAHSAIEDTKATAKLYRVMNEMYKLEFTEVTKREAYQEFMVRVCKSATHKSIKGVLCNANLPNKQKELITYTEEEMKNLFTSFKTPADIYEKSTHSYREIIDVFYTWLNNINVSKFYRYISDQTIYKFAKSLVWMCDSFDDLIEFHTKLYGTEDINLFYYSIVYKLEKDTAGMVYTTEDFDYYFSRGITIEEIAEKTRTPEEFIIEFFIEWAIKNKEEKPHAIKSYIVGMKGLKRILLSGATNSSDKITIGLYNRNFFSILL